MFRLVPTILLTAVLGLLWKPRAVAQEYTFTTLAGTATAGNADGIGSAAKFESPMGLAVDDSGNVFVADLGNSAIRQITPSGEVTTLVTTLAETVRVGGRAGRSGREARFNGPMFEKPIGVAVDSSGNVYVADIGNSAVRKIAPSGQVTTLAIRSYELREQMASGLASEFANLRAIAVDKMGNVYVAQNGNGKPTIWKITAEGKIQTLAKPSWPTNEDAGTALGRGFTIMGGAAVASSPTAVAVDSAGTVYMADSASHTVRKVSPDGTMKVIPGTTGAGGGTFFSYPMGLAIDSSDNVYVADAGHHAIKKITPLGDVTTLASLADERGVSSFGYLKGIAVDRSGNVYSSVNHAILKVKPDGTVVTFAGVPETQTSVDGAGGAARFRAPSSIAVDRSGVVYVVDSWQNLARRITPDGRVSTLAALGVHIGGRHGNVRMNVEMPGGIATDDKGCVYVADASDTIRKITPSGEISVLAGIPKGSLDRGSSAPTPGRINGGEVRFSVPRGIALDRSGTIYVADCGNHAIRKITTDGEVTTLAGMPGTSGFEDGRGSAARFSLPIGIAADREGGIYVADTHNNAIRRISPDGQVITLAGRKDQFSGADGAGDVAGFSEPASVAVDSSGNVFVADSSNNTIRKISPSGEVTTIGGKAGTRGDADGIGSAARFYHPNGVAVDDKGTLYVADSGNGTVRVGRPVEASSKSGGGN